MQAGSQAGSQTDSQAGSHADRQQAGRQAGRQAARQPVMPHRCAACIGKRRGRVMYKRDVASMRR
jgi:hypothetical protein